MTRLILAIFALSASAGAALSAELAHEADDKVFDGKMAIGADGRLRLAHGETIDSAVDRVSKSIRSTALEMACATPAAQYYAPFAASGATATGERWELRVTLRGAPLLVNVSDPALRELAEKLAGRIGCK
jgi:hypothetical protein